MWLDKFIMIYIQELLFLSIVATSYMASSVLALPKRVASVPYIYPLSKSDPHAPRTIQHHYGTSLLVATKDISRSYRLLMYDDTLFNLKGV